MTRFHKKDDADVVYHGMLSPDLPCPLLYLTAENRSMSELLIFTGKGAGLPPLRIEGDPENATLIVKPAKGRAWKVLISQSGGITVTWPLISRPLVYGGGMATPGWCEAALQAGECWLIIGPPRAWGDQASMNQILGHVWESGGAFGVIPVTRTKVAAKFGCR